MILLLFLLQHFCHRWGCQWYHNSRHSLLYHQEAVDKQARVFLTDNSLGPRGHYQMRLFNCGSHFPVECNMVTGNINKKIRLPIRSQKKCNLCASIFRRSITNKTLYCETCNINLCADCYKVFRTQTNNIVDNRRQQQRTLGIKIELQTKKQRIL